jgi:hypothetical protein
MVPSRLGWEYLGILVMPTPPEAAAVFRQIRVGIRLHLNVSLATQRAGAQDRIELLALPGGRRGRKHPLRPVAVQYLRTSQPLDLLGCLRRSMRHSC